MLADKGSRLLYHRPSRMSETKDQPIPAEGLGKGLLWGKTFDFAERQWKILLRPSGFYHQMWHAWAILFGSLLLTTLLAFYMLRKILYTVEIEHRVIKQDKFRYQHILSKPKFNIATINTSNFIPYYFQGNLTSSKLIILSQQFDY